MCDCAAAFCCARFLRPARVVRGLWLPASALVRPWGLVLNPGAPETRPVSDNRGVLHKRRADACTRIGRRFQYQKEQQSTMLATQLNCRPAVRCSGSRHSRVVACAPKPAAHGAAPASRVVVWRPTAFVAAAVRPQRSRALGVARAAASAAEVSIAPPWTTPGAQSAADAASPGCSLHRRPRRSCLAACLKTRRWRTLSRL